jgi:hypothetical protein
MTVVTYNLPHGLKERIDEEADRQSRSASNLVSMWLAEKLEVKCKRDSSELVEVVKGAFWRAYPRKTSKKPTMALLDKMICKNPDPEFWSKVVDDALVRYVNTEPKFIPHPTTYLNQERWEDEIIHENTKRTNQSRAERSREQTRRLFADATAAEASGSYVGEDGPAIRE